MKRLSVLVALCLLVHAAAAAPSLDEAVVFVRDADVPVQVELDGRAALERAWPRLAGTLWPFVVAVPRVTVHLETSDSFAALHRDYIADWGVGLALGRDAWIDAGRAGGGGRSVAEVVLHEVAHCLLQQAVGGGTAVPAWFHEGVAQRLSGEWRLRDTVSLILDGGVPALDRLERNFPADAVGADRYYRASLLAVELFVDRYGEAAVGELVGAVRARRDFVVAFHDVTGETYQAFAEHFASTSRLRFGWIFVVTRWPVLFILMALVFLVGVLFRRRRDRARLEAMEPTSPDFNLQSVWPPDNANEPHKPS